MSGCFLIGIVLPILLPDLHNRQSDRFASLLRLYRKSVIIVLLTSVENKFMRFPQK